MPAQGGLIGVEVYKPPIMLERKYVFCFSIVHSNVSLRDATAKV
jgi:hypothetical protein